MAGQNRPTTGRKKLYIEKKVRPCKKCYKPLLPTETDYCKKHEHFKDLPEPRVVIDIREKPETPPVGRVRKTKPRKTDVVSVAKLPRSRKVKHVHKDKDRERERKAAYLTKEYQESRPVTEKELSIIQALYEDETVVAAAKRIGMSEGMARWHVRIIKLKLNATTVQGIITNALRRGLIKIY